MRIFLTVVMCVAMSGLFNEASASIVEVLRYRLGESGSFSGLLAQDSAGTRDMTVGFNFTAGGVNDTMNPTYSTDATAFGPIVSGTYGADSSGLPTDNFAVEIWARSNNIGQDFNSLFTLNGNTTGSLTFHAGDGTWSASYFGAAWIGAATGTPSQAATANEWTNLAVIRSGGFSTFYINGVAQTGTTDATPSYGNTTAGIHLGITPGAEFFFNGDLDEARIFTFDPNTDDAVAALSINANAIPEPATGWVLAIGAISLMSRRRRQA